MYLNERSRRRTSDGEDGRCHSIAKYMKERYSAIMKSKFPTCLLISIYAVICSLGNVVTAIIYFKHHHNSIGNQKEGYNFSDNMLFNIELNESTFLDSAFEIENEFSNTEDYELYHLFINKTDNEVSFS